MVSGLDFWPKKLGNLLKFFCLCEFNQILLFLGEILQNFGYHWIGGKKKKKKTAIVFPWQLGHPFILFVEMLKFSKNKK